MRWERFFDDLEDQLDAQLEAERQALASEAERVRIAKMSLSARLAVLAADAAHVTVQTRGAAVIPRGMVEAAGTDWVAIAEGHDDLWLVRTDRIVELSLSHADLIASAKVRETAPMSLTERVTFAFMLRDLARKRVGVQMWIDDDRAVSGTVDRVGADHLDFALHDQSSPRRASSIRRHTIVPLAAVIAIRLAQATPLSML